MGDYRVQLRLPGPSDRSIQVQVYFDGLRRLHGRDAFANERGIVVHLSRLRQHLGDDAKYPNIIKTVRGKGYLFIAAISSED